MTVTAWTHELFKLQVLQLTEGLCSCVPSNSYYCQNKRRGWQSHPGLLPLKSAGESRAVCGETLSPSQAFWFLFSQAGAEREEKLGYPIGTSSAVRLNPQMETGRSLKLKSAGRSATRGALAEWREEVHMLCSADCNDLLIKNAFQLPV